MENLRFSRKKEKKELCIKTLCKIAMLINVALCLVGPYYFRERGKEVGISLVYIIIIIFYMKQISCSCPRWIKIKDLLFRCFHHDPCGEASEVTDLLA